MKSCHSAAKPQGLPVLLHSCPGALALASGPFFLLPLLGWMPLMVSTTNPSPGRPHSRPHPTPFCDVRHELPLQKALSKYLQMKRSHPPPPSPSRQDQRTSRGPSCPPTPRVGRLGPVSLFPFLHQ